MSADFIQTIGDCIRMTREVLFSTTGQPFIIAGSGTLGWDQVRCEWYDLDRDLPLRRLAGRRQSHRAQRLCVVVEQRVFWRQFHRVVRSCSLLCPIMV